MQVVIVSKTLDTNYRKYKKIKKMSDLMELNYVPDTLILHDPGDATPLEASMHLTDCKEKGVKRFIYISENPDIMLASTLRGFPNHHIENEEFYLEDEEYLDEYLEEITETSLAVVDAMSSPRVLQDFLVGVKNNDSVVRTPMYLEVVSSAIDELSRDLQNKTELVTTMGDSTVDILKKTKHIMQTIKTQNVDLKKQLDDFQTPKVQQQANNPFKSFGVNMFPSVKYTGTKTVLMVQELSPCRYLTSFLMGYKTYLEEYHHKRVKLVVVHQKGQRIGDKYSKMKGMDFNIINVESSNKAELYEGEYIATNNPKKEVLTKIIGSESDIVIILDRMYSQTPILDYPRAVKLYACGGQSDLARYKVEAKNCIFTTTEVPGGFLTLDVYDPYPVQIDMRKSLYFQRPISSYEKLDVKLSTYLK